MLNAVLLLCALKTGTSKSQLHGFSQYQWKEVPDGNTFVFNYRFVATQFANARYRRSFQPTFPTVKVVVSSGNIPDILVRSGGICFIFKMYSSLVFINHQAGKFCSLLAPMSVLGLFTVTWHFHCNHCSRSMGWWTYSSRKGLRWRTRYFLTNLSWKKCFPLGPGR